MDNTGLIEIYDLDVESLAQVENAVRVMDGVVLASAIRNDQPYVVIECPTEGDMIRLQQIVATVDPDALFVHTEVQASASGASGANVSA